MNESDRRALDRVNAEQKEFPPWIQNALATLVVAVVVVFINRGCTAWDRIDALDDDFRIHVTDGLRKHALLDKDMERLKECLVRLNDVEDEVAHMQQTLDFPFDEGWQNRILENTRNLAVCGCVGSATGVQNLNSR